MADLSARTKIETLMIKVYWTEFHIKFVHFLSLMPIKKQVE